MKKVGSDKQTRARQKKIGPEKMKNITPCFDPLERRGIVDLGGVATGDGVQLVLKTLVMSKKTFWDMKQFTKIVITRPPDHPRA